MKAIVCDAFGPIDDLQYKDVADPVAEPGHVVVCADAALDWCRSAAGQDDGDAPE